MVSFDHTATNSHVKLSNSVQHDHPSMLCWSFWKLSDDLIYIKHVCSSFLCTTCNYMDIYLRNYWSVLVCLHVYYVLLKCVCLIAWVIVWFVAWSWLFIVKWLLVDSGVSREVHFMSYGVVQCCPTFLTLRATFIISRLPAGRMQRAARRP